jgi:N-methylhydantoinase A
MLSTAIRRDLAEPCFQTGTGLDGAELAGKLGVLEERAMAALDGEGVPRTDRHCTHAVDMRYAAQEYTLTVPLADAAEPAGPDFLATVSRRFADLHHDRYGHANPGAPVEFTTLRTSAFGDLGRAQPEQLPLATHEAFPRRLHRAVFDGRAHQTLLVRRDDLAPGHGFTGPAVVVEATATTVVPPGCRVRVDLFGSLVVTVPDAARDEPAVPVTTLPLEDRCPIAPTSTR